MRVSLVIKKIYLRQVIKSQTRKGTSLEKKVGTYCIYLDLYFWMEEYLKFYLILASCTKKIKYIWNNSLYTIKLCMIESILYNNYEQRAMNYVKNLFFFINILVGERMHFFMYKW